MHFERFFLLMASIPGVGSNEKDRNINDLVSHLINNVVFKIGDYLLARIKSNRDRSPQPRYMGNGYF